MDEDWNAMEILIIVCPLKESTFLKKKIVTDIFAMMGPRLEIYKFWDSATPWSTHIG